MADFQYPEFSSESALQFFLPMQPPTVTAQMHKLALRGNRPYFYDPPELAAAREKLTAHLARHRPERPFADVPLRLMVKWCFPATKAHPADTWRITPPDTDNLQKLFKDCMTRLGFWKDDALVASEIIEKFWSDVPGVFVRIEVLEP